MEGNTAPVKAPRFEDQPVPRPEGLRQRLPARSKSSGGFVDKAHGRVVVPRMFCALAGDSVACELARQCGREEGLMWSSFTTPTVITSAFEEQYPTDLCVLLYSGRGDGGLRFCGKHALAAQYWIGPGQRNMWRWVVAVDERQLLNVPERALELVRTFSKQNLESTMSQACLPWGERLYLPRWPRWPSDSDLRKYFASAVTVTPPTSAVK